MISGTPYRGRRALGLSTIASAVIHLIVLTLLFYAIARTFVMRGAREVVSTTQIVSIKKEAPSTPAPSKPAPHVRQHESAPAKTPRHELVKETTLPAPHEAPRHTPRVPSQLERDQAGYAREVAQLNQQNDPHAIPTIDPAARQSSTKSYAFNIPSSMRGDEHGNGIITPTRSWQDRGLNCYYGRYEYTYPDGATESGNIIWPFCYYPGSDPFKEPPHPIPFPLPLIGFKLPPDADMPPIEKQVYHDWAATPGATSSP
ncbi:MAG: hypothetical protein JO146_03745 [Candidatus Eremiobacteraeota bacterium]|nr:hypothetical protein [Candidatus Eremiobacteraeota bacterium]